MEPFTAFPAQTRRQRGRAGKHRSRRRRGRGLRGQRLRLWALRAGRCLRLGRLSSATPRRGDAGSGGKVSTLERSLVCQ